jgi:uncharacterized membrane protein HdeD (DUF308 family)
MNIESVQSLIAGIALFVLGIRIIYDPHIYNYVYGHAFDFTGFNVPLGLAIAIGGILFLWSAFRGKPKQGK